MGEIEPATIITIIVALVIVGYSLAKISEFIINNITQDVPLHVIKEGIEEMKPTLKEHHEKLDELGEQLDKMYGPCKK